MKALLIKISSALALITLFASPAYSQNNSANATSPVSTEPSDPSLSIERPTRPALGRLFYSDERRQSLDLQRKTRQFQETIVEGDSLNLNGMVTRSSGKWTLWVNGSPLNESDTSTISAKPTLRFGRGKLKTNPTTEQSRELAVGTGIDRNTETLISPLGNGSIRVHSRTAGP